MAKKRTSEWPRHGAQALWALLTNSYLVGFAKGKIYKGKLKNLCVPGMNCYSCPGALGSCPIGSLQAVIGSWNFKFAFYVAGFLVFVGALVGRFVCGWLCPFGLIQDLLHRQNGITLARESSDDGYSGGNFNRPGFKGMLKQLEQGKANLVITKDLSRLGRDMREASYYAEQFFPEHGIRYLALGDNFDTEHDNIMAPFQFIGELDQEPVRELPQVAGE